MSPPNDNAPGERGVEVLEETAQQRNCNVRRGRGKAQKTLDMIEAAYRILEEIQPASVRAVCIVRVAIAEQDTTKQAAVPHFLAHDKMNDPRYRWFLENYGERCYELDALSPVILRERVENEILARLDLDAWNHAVEIEAAEIESLKKVMSRWPSISGQAHK